MTKLLEKGIAAIRTLSPEQQDKLGEFLLEVAGTTEGSWTLTPEQLEDLELSIAEADRGEFASDEEVAAMWKKFGL